MSGYVLKPPDAPVTHLIDWRRGDLAPGERVLRDLGWSVRTGEGCAPSLVVRTQEHDSHRSWAVFEGGAPGRIYLVASRVRTSDDRVLCRSVVIRIASGERPAGRICP
jgi:hypothetical protein